MRLYIDMLLLLLLSMLFVVCCSFTNLGHPAVSKKSIYMLILKLNLAVPVVPLKKFKNVTFLNSNFWF